MLATMRSSWLLFALLALLALSSALQLEGALHLDGIEEYLHHGQKRQATATGNSVTSEPSQTPDETTTEPPESTPTPTPTPSREPSSSEDDPTPSSTPAPSTPRSTAGDDPSSTPPPSPVSTPPPDRTSRILVTTSPLVSTTVEQITQVIFITQSDGRVDQITTVSSRTQVHTTGQAVITDPASLNNGGNGGGNDGGGLTEANKKIIGGVVGGVGGAILLGGIAIVCWRIWGRKKRVSADDDDLMAGTGSALGDKPLSGGSIKSSFQSSPEQYQSLGGRPNAAANF